MDFGIGGAEYQYDDYEFDEVGPANNECAEVRHADNECDKTIESPKLGMTFSSFEEVWSYYMKYGKQKGFRVCKRNSRPDDDGNVRWLCLVCAREGTSKSKAANILKPRGTEKVGCMARINASLNNEGGYTLTKVKLDHTHVCSPGKTRHFRCFNKIDTRVAKRLEINDEAGYENVPFGEKKCRNYIDKARQLRLGVGGAEALCNYFRDMQSKNPDFYYQIDVDHELQLKNVFWADTQSRAAYESFGDVITFDTTYLTNAYKMPFAPFVGVNHHGQSILFGCGLISNEDAHTFEWLFEKCVYDSLSKHEFEERWCHMLDTYGLHENAWLGSLYSDRRSWVPAYVRDTFWAGMSTTQRSESMNAFFDDYVNSKTTLKQFVDQYDSALRRKVENEAIADFNSFNTEIPCISRYPLEKQFQKGGRYTFVVADEVQVHDDLLKRANYTVKIDEDPFDVKCSCKLFEFKGILCRHVLRILTQLGKSTVTSKYILDRWRKDVKRKYTFFKSNYDTSSNHNARRYDRIQNCFYELCSNASKAESSTEKLISQLEELKVEYPSIPDHDTTMEGTTGKVLSLVVVRSKRRPPSRRKVHPVEKTLKKPSMRRRLQCCESEVHL
ncbi:hypothetical protein F2P56_015474 [Juglans regia]|uniref:Protein FAR1-RELATED SEQUENCE n=1 Tax=Juglans regia TaxID=51240 RepID=A0A833XFL5_JUGRE|nr:hypothetical protein F2P56_015474 [Juglans regia]